LYKYKTGTIHLEERVEMKLYFAGFEVFTSMSVRIKVFEVITGCLLIICNKYHEINHKNTCVA
jgi:hypothetical protein